MKIVLSGGGTLGSVTPLLAIAKIYKKENSEARFLWVGTKNGVEKKLVEDENIPYYTISSGKWRRYFSGYNFIDLFKIFFGFIQSLFFLIKHRPDLLITVGGFVSVPLHLAGHILRIPAWVHQQDVKLSLANKIMARFAQKNTAANKYCMDCTIYKNAEFIGNPVRLTNSVSKIEAKAFFNIKDDSPVIFILGGGTGSNNINTVTCEIVKKLPKNWHFIHLTGLYRDNNQEEEAKKINPNYRAYKFFKKEIDYAYIAADAVVTRGGLGTLTELSYFKKPCVIIPMFRTHQELNGKMVVDNDAGIVLEEGENLAKDLVESLMKIIENLEQSQEMGKNLAVVLPVTPPFKIIEIIEKLTT
jgi:UDP-N-acetylglucosamine--N-acetylmuramyl-(pentapeptide) pyrophosphoryl-undecaprenol N-acetylglucosamine transferase